MTVTWSVIKPQAATNYVINPSFEVWPVGPPQPTGWVATGGPAIGMDPDYSWRGCYSCYVLAYSGYKGEYQDIPGLKRPGH